MPKCYRTTREAIIQQFKVNTQNQENRQIRIQDKVTILQGVYNYLGVDITTGCVTVWDITTGCVII